MIRRLLITLSSLALAASGMLAFSTPASAAAECTYAGCNGKDPAATDCDDTTDRKASRAFEVGSITAHSLYLNYSTGCKAFWAVFTHNGDSTSYMNGCQKANERGLRGLLHIQTRAPYSGSAWQGYLKVPTKWKICDESYGSGKAWSTMGTSGQYYRARACRQVRNSDGSWTTSGCTSYVTVS